MRRLAFVMMLLSATVCYGQATGTARAIRTGSTLPTTCSPATGDVYFLNSVSVTSPYYCSATNTWTAMGSSAGALTGSGADTRLAFWSATNSLSSASTLTWVSPRLTTPTLRLSNATPNAFLYSGLLGAVTVTAAPTNGQLLVGSTGAAPVVAALTAGSSKLSVTNGAGSIALDVVPANITISDLTGTLAATHGGTGTATFTTGDILYSSAANTLSKLGIGTTGQFLTVAAGIPAWTSSTTAAHSLLSTSHGDSTAAAAVRGDIIVAKGASPLWTRLATGATGTVLLGGTEPSWGDVPLASAVSGVLPAANGGTGTAYFAVAGPTSARTYTFPDANGTMPRWITASAVLDFGSTAAANNADLTITLSGAAAGDAVLLGVPNGSVNDDSCFTSWVSATNTVTVRFNNYSGGAIDPASGTFNVWILK